MEFTPAQIVYQIVLFVALYFVLKALVFDRFLETLDARHHRTRGAVEESAKLRDEAAKLAADYEAQMAKIRHEAATAGEEIRRQAEQAERELVDVARREAADIVAKARATISEEARAARTALEAETGTLAQSIIATLLGRAA